MEWIKITWKNNSNILPCEIYIELDSNRNNTRKIEYFNDGNFGFAYGDIEFNNVCLIEGEFPSVENYNDWNKIYGENDVFEKLVAANISFEEFEEKWKYTLRLMSKQ